MVRAEKKGATIGPIHGSLGRRHETSMVLSEREPEVLSKISDSARNPFTQRKIKLIEVVNSGQSAVGRIDNGDKKAMDENTTEASKTKSP
jgi:hypothetical protein